MLELTKEDLAEKVGVTRQLFIRIVKGDLEADCVWGVMGV